MTRVIRGTIRQATILTLAERMDMLTGLSSACIDAAIPVHWPRTAPMKLRSQLLAALAKPSTPNPMLTMKTKAQWIASDQTNGGTGYAYPPDSDRPICYPCSDKRQIADLKDRSKPFIAYVGNGTITTWTGGKLMTITRSNHCQLTRDSWTHSRNGYMSIHAVDVHGGHWTGRGSEGIAIKLRPVKG